MRFRVVLLWFLVFPNMSYADTDIIFSYGKSSYDLDGREYEESFDSPESFKVSIATSITNNLKIEAFFQNYGDSKGYGVLNPNDPTNTDIGSYYEVYGLFRVTSIGLGITSDLFRTKYSSLEGRIGAHRWEAKLDEHVNFVRSSGDKTPITGAIFVDGEYWNVHAKDNSIGPYIGAKFTYLISSRTLAGLDLALLRAEINGEKANFKSALLFFGFRF